jgi:hypothetical protein
LIGQPDSHLNQFSLKARFKNFVHKLNEVLNLCTMFGY